MTTMIHDYNTHGTGAANDLLEVLTCIRSLSLVSYSLACEYIDNYFNARGSYS